MKLKIAIILITVVVLLCCKLTDCIIHNLHNIAIYSVKDIYDYFKHKKWRNFNYFGIDMFVGMFGHGKTLSLANQATLLYKRYGDSIQFISNIKLNGIPYTPLVNFNQLVDLGTQNSDYQGTVVIIDEISSVLSHRNYSNFPLELIGLLCQQRKRHVYIMCTAQRFFMVDKIWRSITTRVIDCHKYWRFQHGEIYDAWDYENASNASMLKRQDHVWWFVKDSAYNAYDTAEMVDKDACSNFISNEEAIIRKGLDSGRICNDLSVNKPSRKAKKFLRRK